jgi:hypothetical protein
VKLRSLFPPGGLAAAGLFCFSGQECCGGVVSFVPMPYTAAGEHHMTLLNKIFTTRTLLQIIFVLAATVILKATSSHYDFSWATALAAG